MGHTSQRKPWLWEGVVFGAACEHWPVVRAWLEAEWWKEDSWLLAVAEVQVYLRVGPQAWWEEFASRESHRLH